MSETLYWPTSFKDDPPQDKSKCYHCHTLSDDGSDVNLSDLIYADWDKDGCL